MRLKMLKRKDFLILTVKVGEIQRNFMKTVIVDYSKNYYQNIMGTDVPDKYSGKFV
ncbi:MAG: hypothetical protein N2511_03690 [Thermodesulfovibrionales bacterium]|nr:hypothetical protein [Thermodesulfovibrionales bacterium]